MTSILCHVGLAKCASTTLQTSWDNATNYTGYFSHDLVATVRDSVLNNQSDLPQLKKVIEQNRLGAGAFSDATASYVVISDESFTNSGIATAADPQIARDVQECIAISLEACVDRVLMMVRDPLSWIRSAYYQQIKQGAAYDFNEFMTTRRRNIIENLDLGGILARFSRLDRDLVVLPMELLSSNEKQFWRDYEARLDFPAPDSVKPTDRLNTNVTLANTMTLHRSLNALLERMEASVTRGNSPDRAMVLDALKNARTWGTRRALTFANADDLAFIEDALGTPSTIEPTIYQLDDVFTGEIEEKFLAPLRARDFFPYPDIWESYAASLSERVIEVY